MKTFPDGTPLHFETRAIHDGHSPDKFTGAVSVPVYQTSVFASDENGDPREFLYSRLANPTRSALEDCLANLEGARHGMAFASGVAAAMAALELLQSGDRLVAMAEIYGGTLGILEKIAKPRGIAVDYVTGTDPEDYRRALREKAKMVWIESPGNPLLAVADIAAIAKVTHEAGAILAIDNTFASPYLQTPLALGADIVIHSTSKYLAGHSDVIGGAVAVNDEALYEKIHSYQVLAGAIPGPWDCWLTLRGIRTLKVRMEEACKNAGLVAEALRGFPSVTRVYYPGLPGHPGHEIAARQMRLFGAVVSADLAGGTEAVRRASSRVKLFVYSGSLGGVESQMGHPATMSHRIIGKAEREKRGIGEGLVRLSIGLENPEDLIADLSHAFGD